MRTWEVNGTAIGTVTDTHRMRVFAGSELVGDMPVTALVDDCPLYDLAPARPSAPIYDPPAATLARDASPHDALLALLSCPNIASRRPLFEQYDSIVQSRTVRRPEQADAAVLALDCDPSPAGEDRPIPALAVSIDCNGRRVAADPYTGTVAAVLECASNLACVGAEPLGTTNNLNFGNPEKRHIAWQLTESVRGLGDACRALDAPIVGGNVSLYNEGATGPIYPTPVIGMVGRLPDAARAGRLGFAREGDEIALVGPFAPALPASELAKLRGESCRTGCRTSISGRSAAPRSSSATPSASARSLRATTSPRAASRRPRRVLPRGGHGGETCGSSQPATAIPSLPSSARPPAASWSAAHPTPSARWAGAHHTRVIGTVGGDALQIDVGD